MKFKKLHIAPKNIFRDHLLKKKKKIFRVKQEESCLIHQKEELINYYASDHFVQVQNCSKHNSGQAINSMIPAQVNSEAAAFFS